MKKRSYSNKNRIPTVETVTVLADPDYGLTAEQVDERLKNGLANYSVKSPSKSIPEIIKDNLFTYFNLIFAVLALLLIAVGSIQGLTFLPVVIANTLIGIYQEIRAKIVLDKLNVLSAPKTIAIRDGSKTSIPSEKLVRDDIVELTAGNQIAADAVVVSGDVSVNEALLTGEADEVAKKNGDDLKSGSFVVSGSCRARLEKVGADSYISKLTIQAKTMKDGEQSEMIRSLNDLLRLIGMIIIPIGLILFIQSYFFGGADLKESMTSMVAAVLGMIPEGLYLLTSIALFVSVVRLAEERVLAHDMKCIETLARVDVLCVDKTGTITDNTMTVDKLIAADDTLEGNEKLARLVGDLTSAMENDNITMGALKKTFDRSNARKAVSFTPFSSRNKYSSAAFEDGSYVLGAPEFVLRDDYKNYQEQIEQYSARGYRVLVFAAYPGKPDGGPLTGKADYLGMILMSNPIRKEAPDTFRYFREQGVDIKVISGDNPVTVSEVAKKAGIAGSEHYVDASKILPEDNLGKILVENTVFGRVTPEQKREFVHALKQAGKTVAMTGDGVNDVLALKDSDCSIAMASGSQAATQVSQLVLLDSDFAKMPSVVQEGRRVVNNIQRSASLFLTKNIFSFLLAILFILCSINYPLQPSQISLISAFTIGIPGFFLALLPNRKIIKGNFLSNVMMMSIPAGFTDFVLIGLFVIVGNIAGMNSDEISTASTIIIAAVGFMFLFRISRPMDFVKFVIWTFCLVCIILCGYYFNNIFMITLHLAKNTFTLMVVFIILIEPVFRYNLWLTEKFGNFMMHKIRDAISSSSWLQNKLSQKTGQSGSSDSSDPEQ
ncbi:MAG: cation-translocating P-type ATPase [Eubacteriaceae bacterium]|jgi:cation-transporting ATPase E